MPRSTNNFFKMEMLLLKVIEIGDGEYYEYKIKLAEYPNLYRLLDNSYISDEKKLVGKRKIRIYYRIEPKGKEYLEQLYSDYLDMNNNILKKWAKKMIKPVKKYIKECRCAFPFVSSNEKIFLKRLENNI